MTQNKSKPTVIKCPHCGAEYLPSEIFMPEDILGGAPKNLIKDPLGKVLYADWEEDEEPTLRARYECDCCGKAFVVEATVSYKATPEAEELDFGSDSVSLLG